MPEGNPNQLQIWGLVQLLGVAIWGEKTLCFELLMRIQARGAKR